MDDAYKEYEYRRFKPPLFRRKRLFALLVTLVILVTVFFCANLVFGFVNLSPSGPGNTLDIQSTTFHVTQSEPYTDKAKAMFAGVAVRREGGSGYLVAQDNAWRVIHQVRNQTFTGAVSITTTPARMTLTDNEHRGLVEILVASFVATFDTLNDFFTRFTDNSLSQREISNSARIAYNNLLDLTVQLELVQSTARNPHYAMLLEQLTFQLLGLHLIWMDGNSENFSHVMQNAMSWTIFAFKHLTESLIR